MDIQDDDFDVLRGQLLDEELAEAIAASGDDHELLLPVPLIARPVVESTPVQEIVHIAREAQVEADLQAAQSRRMLEGKFLTLACVAREKEERQCQGRVEDGVLDDGIDEIGCKA